MDQKKYDFLHDQLDLEKLDIVDANRKNPILRQDAAEECAKAQKIMAKAELAIDQLKGELDGFLRQQHKANGDKITEAQLSSMIERNEDMKALQDAFIEEESNYRQWSHLERSYQSREKSIENEIRMVVGGFIAYQKAENGARK
jgi:aspartokinase